MRLLLSGVGSIPTGNVAGWTRATEPLMSASVAWEQVGGSSVQEPSVLYESGIWKMWYTGGWTSSAIGYASCTSDPTVAGNWTKYVSNPVLGQGGSGIAGFAARVNVIKSGSTYYMFYSDTSAAGGNLKVSTSSDGLAWNAPSTALAKAVVAWMPGGWANSTVWGSPGAWKMLVDGSTNASGGPPWAIAYAISANTTPDSGWTVQGTGPLASLAIPGYAAGYTGMIMSNSGAPLLNSLYYIWYHAQIGSDSDIIHAHSSDFQNWTVAGNFDLYHSGGTYEIQQVADPDVLEVNGTSYMFFSGTDNVTPKGYINVATYPGTLVNYVVAHP